MLINPNNYTLTPLGNGLLKISGGYFPKCEKVEFLESVDNEEIGYIEEGTIFTVLEGSTEGTLIINPIEMRI